MVVGTRQAPRGSNLQQQPGTWHGLEKRSGAAWPSGEPRSRGGLPGFRRPCHLLAMAPCPSFPPKRRLRAQLVPVSGSLWKLDTRRATACTRKVPLGTRKSTIVSNYLS